MGTDKHALYLEELSSHRNLRKIGEDKRKTKVIFYEPVWLFNGRQAEAPDMLLERVSGTWVVIELKGSKKKREKAKSQIASGKQLLHRIFGIPLNKIIGKMVFYSKAGYKYETC